MLPWKSPSESIEPRPSSQDSSPISAKREDDHDESRPVWQSLDSSPNTPHPPAPPSQTQFFPSYFPGQCSIPFILPFPVFIPRIPNSFGHLWLPPLSGQAMPSQPHFPVANSNPQQPPLNFLPLYAPHIATNSFWTNTQTSEPPRHRRHFDPEKPSVQTTISAGERAPRTPHQNPQYEFKSRPICLVEPKTSAQIPNQDAPCKRGGWPNWPGQELPNRQRNAPLPDPTGLASLETPPSQDILPEPGQKLKTSFQILARKLPSPECEPAPAVAEVNDLDSSASELLLSVPTRPPEVFLPEPPISGEEDVIPVAPCSTPTVKTPSEPAGQPNQGKHRHKTTVSINIAMANYHSIPDHPQNWHGPAPIKLKSLRLLVTEMYLCPDILVLTQFLKNLKPGPLHIVLNYKTFYRKNLK